ncbi:hypothetical protein MRB53_041111 [Persea americana]|nr:hypothetical protein MRB53_041111 [Persea americana]
MNSRQKGLVAPGYTLTSARPTALRTALELSVVYLCSALPYDELTPRSSSSGCLAARSIAKTSLSQNQHCYTTRKTLRNTGYLKLPYSQRVMLPGLPLHQLTSVLSNDEGIEQSGRSRISHMGV